MKIPTKIIIIFCLLSGGVFAQKNIDPTPEDIQLAKRIRDKYSKDDVAILSSTDNVSFEINKKEDKVIVRNNVNEILMNINHRADISKYEFYDSESEILTFNLKYRNDKNAKFYLIDQFYKDNDLFYNDARVKYMNVDFPVQGYTYAFELEKKYQDIKYFTSIYFNEQYPVIKKTVVVNVPDWLNLELKEFNFQGNTIVKTIEHDVKKEMTTYTYVFENIPAMDKEENTPGASFKYPHLLIIAKSFKNKGSEVTLFKSTADLYKWYKSLVDQMKDDPTVFKDKVKELTEKAKTDIEKIKNIYYWVQDNIRYIAFEDGIAGFKPDESNNVYSKRYGDCKGMANLIKQMLKQAGFDARLTWIGTKHIAYNYSTPSLAVDNHMICTVILKDRKYFLDGTEKFNSLGEYAERIQDKEVMIENGSDFIIEKIPLSTSSSNKEIYNADFVIVNEKLKGNCTRSSIGEARSQFLHIYDSFEINDKEKVLDKYLSNSDKNIQIENIKTSNLKDRDQKININYGIVIDNKVSSFDNDIYVDLENRNEYKDFELKDRKSDYLFEYKKNYESNVTLVIPNGYKLIKLPADLIVNEPDYSIAINFIKKGNTIFCKKSFVFKNALIKVKEIDRWNAFIQKLNSVYNQQIILTKQ